MDLARPGSRASAAAAQPVARAGHVFVSYARVDARRANDIEHTLAGWGFATWMDRLRLGGGENWSSELERAIDASAAVVLVVSPAALASPMVRQEYLRALALGIPLTLVTWDRSAMLPPELAHAPLVDMRSRLRAAPAVYFALVDRGAAPIPMAGELAQRSIAATAPALLTIAAGRAPADWQVIRAPMWSYWLRMAGRFAPAALYLLALNAIPSTWWRMLNGEQVRYWLVNTLAPPLVVAALLFALPGLAYLFIVTRRVEREMVVLTPESCVISALNVRRFTALPTLSRYLYRWAAAARTESGVSGSLRVIFTGRDGAMATFRLPWYWPNRDAIGQRVAADVAASAPLAPPELRSAPPPDSLTVTAYPVAYGLLAPQRNGALVAALQGWLRSRGLTPVEMVWTSGQQGVLAPTARGAAACRVVMFVDTPAITHDPRWRAVLADLRQRGVTLIPLRTGSRPPTASDWSALQWVDFSNGIARERSFLSLCDTLDRNGLLPTIMAPSLDTELAIARATYQRLPPGWRSFAGELALQSIRARLRNNWALKVTLFVGLVAIVAAAVAGYLMIAGISTALGVSSAALSAEVGILTFYLLIALLLGALAYQIVARRWSNAELVREQTIQERLIIAPDGLVYHLLTGRGSRLAKRMILGSLAPEDPIGGVAHGCLAFAWIATIEGRSTWSGARTMRIGLRDGAVITLPLLSLGASAELALETAREALRGWRERGSATGVGSAVTDV